MCVRNGPAIGQEECEPNRTKQSEFQHSGGPAASRSAACATSSRCCARSSKSPFRTPTGGIWSSTSAVVKNPSSASQRRLPALPARIWPRQIPLRPPGSPAAVHREGMMVRGGPGIPGIPLTEVLSKRHAKGAGVASLRLFTITGIRMPLRFQGLSSRISSGQNDVVHPGSARWRLCRSTSA